jgi:hypothetical protein
MTDWESERQELKARIDELETVVRNIAETEERTINEASELWLRHCVLKARATLASTAQPTKESAT